MKEKGRGIHTGSQDRNKCEGKGNLGVHLFCWSKRVLLDREAAKTMVVMETLFIRYVLFGGRLGGVE